MKCRLPRPAAAVLAALDLSEPNATGLETLSAAEWDRALEFSDSAGLSLFVRERCGAHLPEPIGRRLDHNYAQNTERVGRLRQAYCELADALKRMQAEHLVLKGFTQAPGFIADLRARVQYDLDLYCPGESLERARAAARALGYETVSKSDPGATDHLPAMARKTGWQWRGDYFDPEIPIVLELHHQLWDETTEGFRAEGWESFWDRRTRVPLEDGAAPALAPADALAYAALHLLRHLLRGNLKPCHVYELACFLDRSAAEETFWNAWRGAHSENLRRLQAIGFRLARGWFGGRVARAAEAEIEALPGVVAAWFERYVGSPAENCFHPNKDELWLHVALLSGWRARAQVIRRRLLPARLPAHVDGLYIPEGQMTLRLRARKWYRYAKFLQRRLRFHLRATAPVAWRGIGWMWIVAASRRGPQARAAASRTAVARTQK